MSRLLLIIALLILGLGPVERFVIANFINWDALGGLGWEEIAAYLPQAVAGYLAVSYAVGVKLMRSWFTEPPLPDQSVGYALRALLWLLIVGPLALPILLTGFAGRRVVALGKALSGEVPRKEPPAAADPAGPQQVGRK
jgi:hypothetical protein